MKLGRKTAERFASSIRYSKEGLVPVAVCGADSGRLLMMAYADREAVVRTLTSGFAWFFSRSRKSLWKKGETSDNRMWIVSVAVDCDSDALTYEVEVLGGGNACHLGREGCFVKKFGKEEDRLSIAELSAVIEERAKSNDAGSYTMKLLSNRKLACSKVEEESAELAEALQKKNRKEVAWEACDLLYHALVAARGRGVKLAEIEKELARRHKKKG